MTVTILLQQGRKLRRGGQMRALLSDYRGTIAEAEGGTVENVSRRNKKS